MIVDFVLSNGETLSIKIENITGKNKQSSYSYSHVKLNYVIQQLTDNGVRLVSFDHVGINFPWFSSGIHPRLQHLREILPSKCLYHQFPTGEPWDFIIPGDLEEIYCDKEINYKIMRRPKFEVVSFAEASIPLIQFDLLFDTNFEMLEGLFPEGLVDSEIGNIWIYLENPFMIDVCIVANKYSENDWSEFIKGSRI